MRPPDSPCSDSQGNLFRVELVEVVNHQHSLVRLADEVDWARFGEAFGVTYADNVGRPGVPTRLMVALHYLKYAFNLSDEQVLARWLENPYWQYLSGMKFFEHRLPIGSSSMTRWRGGIGEAGAQELLTETIEAGLRLKLVRTSQLQRVNVDTTVMEKHVRFPTDARLYQRARLVTQAKAEGMITTGRRRCTWIGAAGGASPRACVAG